MVVIANQILNVLIWFLDLILILCFNLDVIVNLITIFFLLYKLKLILNYNIKKVNRLEIFNSTNKSDFSSLPYYDFYPINHAIPEKT